MWGELGRQGREASSTYPPTMAPILVLMGVTGEGAEVGVVSATVGVGRVGMQVGVVEGQREGWTEGRELGREKGCCDGCIEG